MKAEDESHEDKGSSNLQKREVIPKCGKKNKILDNLKEFLEKVVFNASSFLSTFQENIVLLKNIDKLMAAILEKLYLPFYSIRITT